MQHFQSEYLDALKSIQAPIPKKKKKKRWRKKAGIKKNKKKVQLDPTDSS